LASSLEKKSLSSIGWTKVLAKATYCSRQKARDSPLTQNVTGRPLCFLISSPLLCSPKRRDAVRRSGTSSIELEKGERAYTHNQGPIQLFLKVKILPIS